MDISSVKMNVDQGSSTYGGHTGEHSAAAVSTAVVKVETKADVAVTPVADDQTDTKVDKKSVTVEDLKKITAAMNQYVESMDTNIRFKYHDKTKELMVQVVDQTTSKVIKEFPSHEFLDTIAAIRSIVGLLLDKKM